ATMGANERNHNATNSTFIFPSSTSETTIITFDPSQYFLFEGIWLDVNALTQNAIIRVKRDLHNTGTFYTFETLFYDATSVNEGVILGRKVPGNGDIRVTVQSETVEGASRNIPYEYWYLDLSTLS
ncbi:MAG: hypothetical protein ABIC57_01945, partial [bacterium]